MRTTVTVSVRGLVLTVVATMAVLAAYVIGSTQAETSTAAAAGSPASARAASIVMTGTGEATGVPDQVAFSLAIRASAADISTALRSANATTLRVLRAVRDQDVARRDVQTTGLSINPNYDYSDDAPPVITGYSVTESMSVLVRELPNAGATISTAVSAGGNAVRLHGVRLQIGDEDALVRQARAAAIGEARDKAEQYAAAAGRELGEVSSVREVSAAPRIDQTAYRYATLDAAAIPAVPIRAGSADLRVTVSVVWSFA